MHTNQTQYYNLPQYVGNDIINPLVDTNGAYETIDTTLHNIAEAQSGDASDISALETKVGTDVLTTVAPDLSGAVNEIDAELDTADTGIKARLLTAEGEIDTLQSQMVTAQGNITDLQNNKANKSDFTGTYQLVEPFYITVTADGVKTRAAVLNDLYAAFLAYQSNTLPANHVMYVDAIGTPTLHVSKNRGFIQKTDVIGSLSGVDFSCSDTAYVSDVCKCSANSELHRFRATTSGNTIINEGADVSTENDVYEVRGFIYKPL